MLSDIRDVNRRFSTAGTIRFDSIQTATILTSSGFTHPSEDDLQSSFRRDFVDSALVSIVRQTFDINFSGATIFGDKNDSLKIALTGRSVSVSYRGPITNQRKDSTVSLATKSIPMSFGGVLPQISMGTLFGTQAKVRYIP